MFFNTKLLARIREDPEGLLGARSIQRLDSFLTGSNLYSGQLSDIMWYPINEHLQVKYGCPYLPSFASLLALVSNSDSCAFDLFYRELDEYLAANFDAAHNSALWPHQWPWPPGAISPGYGNREAARNVTRLHAFLAGEAEALRSAGVENPTTARLVRFEAWLNEREKLGTDCRWDRIVLKFFELLYKFNREIGADDAAT
jgi:hypothetical protein